MDEVIKIMTEGEVIEIFPYEDEELTPGHFEAIVSYDETVYHLLLSPDKQPIKINHIASIDDYDLPTDADGWDAYWENVIDDGLEDDPWDGLAEWEEEE